MTHHENSRTHWTELPRRFLDSLPAHDRACGLPPILPCMVQGFGKGVVATALPATH